MQTRRQTIEMWIGVLLSWGFVAGFLLSDYMEKMKVGFGDTDIALRLVELRQYAAGQPWYDLTIDRMHPPEGLVSHWSRLVDAGLLGLQDVFSVFTSPGEAELLMRAWWPLLWLVPTIVGMCLIARRLADGRAAILAAVGCASAAPAFVRFAPGNIDHHNVQTALSILAVLATIAAQRSRAAAVAAGLISGLMLAIGLENAMFIALVLMVFGLRFVFDPASARHVPAFGMALAAASVLSLASALPPDRWSETYCDQVAINIALPMFLSGALMAMVGAARDRMQSSLARFAAMGVIAIVAATTFYGLDPACIAGPFGHIDPAIRPIWLDNVQEARSLLTFLISEPERAIPSLSFPAFVVLACLVYLAVTRSCEQSWLIAFASLVTSCVMMVSMIRAAPYTLVFAIPLAAALAVRAWQRYSITSPTLRLLTLLPALPVTVMIGAIAAGQLAGLPAAAEKPNNFQACSSERTIAPLRTVPSGIVMTPIDLGPAVLAYTDHKVVVGPYHRLSKGILESHRAFNAPMSEAHEAVRESGATLLAFCNTVLSDKALAKLPRDSLTYALRIGETPDWLAEIPNDSDSEPKLKMYRVLD